MEYATERPQGWDTESRFRVYRQLVPASWRDLLHLAERLDGWVFRGQRDVRWTLQTSLERAADELNLSPRERWLGEGKMLRDFRRRAHHYLSRTPDDNDDFEWLALMQHHGAPTRLLDFTHSFYVGVFFALDGATSDAALWAIDKEAVRRIAATLNDLDPDSDELDLKNALTLQGGQPYVACGEPEIMNERLAAQQGLFAWPADHERSFMDNYFAMYGASKDVIGETPWAGYRALGGISWGPISLIKIALPVLMHDEAWRNLRRMNITHASLFPGLDGFARSLALDLRDRMPPTASDSAHGRTEGTAPPDPATPSDEVRC